MVHTCLEGPEVGVYYRGKGEIINNESVIIKLPDYVDALAYNFTTHVTHIYEKTNPFTNYSVSDVENGMFTVYCENGKNGKFNWVVYGERCPIIVEPLKSSVNRRGNGPYTWLEPK